MPGKVEQTFAVSGNVIYSTPATADAAWPLSDTSAVFFTIGGRGTYMITPRFGIAAGVAYMNASSSMTAETLVFAGLRDNNLLGGIMKQKNGAATVGGVDVPGASTAVNGVTASLGAAFRPLNAGAYRLSLIPEFTVRAYTLKTTVPDDVFGFTVDSQTYYASYDFRHEVTELGAAITVELALPVSANIYVAARCAAGVGFYQFKTMTETVSFTGTSNEIIFELEANTGLWNPQIMPSLGFGVSF